MAEVTIRAPELADAREIESLRIAGWKTAYRGIISDGYLDALTVDADRRRRRMTERTVGFAECVAVADGVIVGWTVAGPCRDPDRQGARHGEIFACYVLPGRWRHGVGRLLLRRALEALAQAGRDDVSLWVLEANDRARRFYETLGFEPDGARKLFDSDESVPEVRYLRRPAT
jgi:ribosomal protein S18 acetylase RimI-like enzyme